MWATDNDRMTGVVVEQRATIARLTRERDESTDGEDHRGRRCQSFAARSEAARRMRLDLRDAFLKKVPTVKDPGPSPYAERRGRGSRCAAPG